MELNGITMKKQFSKGFGKYGSCVLSREWNKGFLIAVTAAMLLLSGSLFAQSSASKQPLPTFNNNGRWASSNGNVCSSIFFSQTMNMYLGSGRILSACCCF